MIDNRQKYMKEEWQQGELFVRIGSWSAGDWDAEEQAIKCKIYVNSSLIDMGRSRKLVYTCTSSLACKRMVNKHNKEVKLTRLLLPEKEVISKATHSYGSAVLHPQSLGLGRLI